MISEIVGLFRSRAAGNRMPEPGTDKADLAVLPDSDDSEMESTPIESPAVEFLGMALLIDYVDSKGSGSTRRITVNAIEEKSGNLLLKAHCHERKAARSFRADRIRSATDLSTGEVFDNPLAEIRRAAGLVDLPTGSREAATAQAMKNARPGLAVLLFLARCDGEQHPSEDLVILDYLDSHAPPPGLDRAAAKSAMARFHPNEDAFEAALEALANDERELFKIVHYAGELITADGVITDEERLFAGDLADLTEEFL